MPKFSSISTFSQFRKSRARESSNKFLSLVPQQEGSKFSLMSPDQKQEGKCIFDNKFYLYRVKIDYR